MGISIEIYFENGKLHGYIGDDCGGSCIKVEGDTPQALVEALSPHIADYADQCALAIDNGDGRIAIRLSDGSRVYCKETHGVVVTEKDGTEICSVKDLSLPGIESIDEEYIETLEQRMGCRE